jgi:hypothetical protein
MPRFPQDFSKTIMYKISCNDPTITDVYIGSTTNLKSREAIHKSACNNEFDFRHHFKLYEVIRENGNWNNWKMEMLEEYPCTCSDESSARERSLINEHNASLNIQIPGRTHKEYYRDNVEKIIRVSKQNYQDHKEKYLKNAKTRCECVCGITYNKSGKTMHLRTDKHINFIKRNEQQNDV